MERGDLDRERGTAKDSLSILVTGFPPKVERERANQKGQLKVRKWRERERRVGGWE